MTIEVPNDGAMHRVAIDPRDSGEKPKRRVIVVDTETTGLNDHDIVVEVAWWDLTTDERGHFIPRHDVGWVLEHAHPTALEINGYRERLVDANHDDGTEVNRLHHVLRGQVIAGSNIRYDVAKLARVFREHGLHPEPAYYHLIELAPYACGVLGLPVWDPPGLEACARLLDVPSGNHQATDDVTATGLCFLELFTRAGCPIPTIEKASA